MEIIKQRSGDALEIKVQGRLDAYWADHLSTELAETLREGARNIRLNLSEVTYLSSAGIRVLLLVHKQVKAIQGSLSVVNPSEAVKTTLDLAGLKQLLIPAEAAAVSSPEVPPGARVLEKKQARFEILDGAPGSSFSCRVLGSPEKLSGCRFQAEDCRDVRFPASSLGIGLGAFGNGFDDCRGRFGEFLAVGGAAAYLPTDDTNVPDYMVAAGDLVPSVKVLYGVACEGAFAKVAHFERNGDGGFVPFSEIVAGCLEIAGGETVVIAMIAESSGLMGVALQRSPVLEAAADAPFRHPEIRQWLSFTPERAYPRSLTLAVGIAAASPSDALGPFVRPLGKVPSPSGHFHAAAFSYRPLKKAETDLYRTVATLFGEETIQGLLHLINDDREIAGAGESEFVRGACWIGPVSRFLVERS